MQSVLFRLLCKLCQYDFIYLKGNTKMRIFFKKPFRWAIIYLSLLTLFTAYVLLNTFVVSRALATVVTAEPSSEIGVEQSQLIETETESEEDDAVSEDISDSVSAEAAPVITKNSYQDENIKITIETEYIYNTQVYIADIQISDVSYLKTAFAENTYGRNIKETTSEMAEENEAIFAVNGDYYGFRDYGFVLRNGVLYRDTASKAGDDEALLIDSNGEFYIINETEVEAQDMENNKAWQVLSFGPALIDEGNICVNERSEVGQAKSSNPRTAIGQISELHYIVIVADGRTNESEGLSLLELARIFQERDCTVAYNLDGGGSSTMWFNGEVINNPTSGRTNGERSVSDIVYFG